MARPRQVSDEDIARAARATFMEHGPQASVAMVAEKLGVSHAALFQRAGSKEALMLRSLIPGVPEVVAVLERGPDPEPGVGRQLLAILGALHRSHRELVPGLVVLRAGCVDLGKALPEGEPPPVGLRRLLARWLVSAKLAGERRARALAEGLLGAVEARCFNEYLGGPSFSGVASDEAFVRELLHGILPDLAL